MHCLICAFFFTVISLQGIAQRYYSLGAGLNNILLGDKDRALSCRILGETSLAPFMSFRASLVQGPFGYGWAEQSGSKVYNVRLKGWGIDVGPKFYLRSKKNGGPWGFYLGPDFVFRRVLETFKGYLIDNNMHQLNSGSFPYADIQEKGLAYGAGIALGWKSTWKFLFLESGLSVNYAKASFTSSENHRIISRYYKTSDIVNFNLFISLGLFYSKGTFTRTIKDEIPFSNLRQESSYSIITLYSPLSTKKYVANSDIMVNDTVIGKYLPGKIYNATSLKDSSEMKVKISSIISSSLCFYPRLDRHYYLRILLPKSHSKSIPEFKFVKPEVGEYDIKLIQKSKKDDLKE